MILDDYINEIKEDTKVSEINLKEKSLSLPGLKAKWVSRLINHKNTLASLERSKKQKLKNLIPKVKETLPVKLSDTVIKETAESTEEISLINSKIETEKSIIDFLERAEKIMSSFTYDIGNIAKIIQLETL